MIDLKRTIKGVSILADTDDKAKAAEVQRVLDAGMKALAMANSMKKIGKSVDWLKDFGASVRK